jgi:hypothetical protein
VQFVFEKRETSLKAMKQHRMLFQSLTRDFGSVEDAVEIYQQELSRMKLLEFKGDFALLNSPKRTLGTR